MTFPSESALIRARTELQSAPRCSWIAFYFSQSILISFSTCLTSGLPVTSSAFFFPWPARRPIVAFEMVGARHGGNLFGVAVEAMRRLGGSGGGCSMGSSFR